MPTAATAPSGSLVLERWSTTQHKQQQHQHQQHQHRGRGGDTPSDCDTSTRAASRSSSLATRDTSIVAPSDDIDKMAATAARQAPESGIGNASSPSSRLPQPKGSASPPSNAGRRFPSLLSRKSSGKDSSSSRKETSQPQHQQQQHNRASSTATIPRSASGIRSLSSSVAAPANGTGMSASASVPVRLSDNSTSTGIISANKAASAATSTNMSPTVSAAGSGIPQPKRLSGLYNGSPDLSKAIPIGVTSAPRAPQHDRKVSTAIPRPMTNGENSTEISAGHSEHLVTSKPSPRLHQHNKLSMLTTSQPTSGITADAVPPMWRTSSYNGSTRAHISASSSLKNSLGAGGVDADLESQSTGMKGLEALEVRYPASRTAFIESGITDASLRTATGTTLINARICLLRRLIQLLGEHILEGCDMDRLVWLDGVHFDMNWEDELSKTKNGAALATAGTSPAMTVPSPDSSKPIIINSVGMGGHNNQVRSASPKKPNLFDRVAAKFGGHSSASASASSTHGLSQKHTRKVSSASSASSKIPQSRNSSVAAVPQVSVNSGQSKIESSITGAVFGSSIADTPAQAYAVSIIGGQRHQLPTLMFALVEAIFKRGLSLETIFRKSGDQTQVAKLVAAYNTPPHYGDELDLAQFDIDALAEVLQKYLADLAGPVVSAELWPALQRIIIHDQSNGRMASSTKLAAVQVLLRLLPRRNLSLLIYLIAFLFQLPMNYQNGLTIDSVSAIFGPSILRPRPAVQEASGTTSEPEVAIYQKVLAFMLHNWDESLSQDLLDDEYDCLSEPILNASAASSVHIDDSGLLAVTEEEELQSPQVTSRRSSEAVLAGMPGSRRVSGVDQRNPAPGDVKAASTTAKSSGAPVTALPDAVTSADEQQKLERPSELTGASSGRSASTDLQTIEPHHIVSVSSTEAPTATKVSRSASETDEKDIVAPSLCVQRSVSAGESHQHSQREPETAGTLANSTPTFRRASLGGLSSSPMAGDVSSSNFIIVTDYSSNDEFGDDRNAAQLFGSLGNLYMTQKRQLAQLRQQLDSTNLQHAEHQSRLEQLNAKNVASDAHLQAVSRQLSEARKEIAKLEAERIHSNRKQRDEEEAYMQLHKQLQEADKQHQAALAVHASEMQRLRDAHQTAVAALRTEHEQEKHQHLERNTSQMETLRAEAQQRHAERDAARRQLERIKALFDDPANQ